MESTTSLDHISSLRYSLGSLLFLLCLSGTLAFGVSCSACSTWTKALTNISYSLDHHEHTNINVMTHCTANNAPLPLIILFIACFSWNGLDAHRVPSISLWTSSQTILVNLKMAHCPSSSCYQHDSSPDRCSIQTFYWAAFPAPWPTP